MTEYGVTFTLGDDDLYPLIDLSSTSGDSNDTFPSLATDSSESMLKEEEQESVLVCDDMLSFSDEEICEEKKERKVNRTKGKKIKNRIIKAKELVGSVVVFNKREYERATKVAMPF